MWLIENLNRLIGIRNVVDARGSRAGGLSADRAGKETSSPGVGLQANNPPYGWVDSGNRGRESRAEESHVRSELEGSAEPVGDEAHPPVDGNDPKWLGSGENSSLPSRPASAYGLKKMSLYRFLFELPDRARKVRVTRCGTDGWFLRVRYYGILARLRAVCEASGIRHDTHYKLNSTEYLITVDRIGMAVEVQELFDGAVVGRWVKP